MDIKDIKRHYAGDWLGFKWNSCGNRNEVITKTPQCPGEWTVAYIDDLGSNVGCFTINEIALWSLLLTVYMETLVNKCACGCGATENLTKGVGAGGSDMYLCPDAAREAAHPKM